MKFSLVAATLSASASVSFAHSHSAFSSSKRNFNPLIALDRLNDDLKGITDEEKYVRKCGHEAQFTVDKLTKIEQNFQSHLSLSGKDFNSYRTKAAVNLNADNVTNTASDGKIDVYWHVIWEGSSRNASGGYLHDDKVQANIDALNEGYKKTGIQFELKGITRTKNDKWFNRVGPSGNELKYATAMKERLRTGGPEVLNVYSVGFNTGSGEGLLGYATFPQDYAESPKNDGVVISYASVPGGSATKFNQGKTLVHEVGHWLGLYHVFSDNGVCTGSGDYVEDTPAQALSTAGCPSVAPDSCPSAGSDSIHNFMDYSWDECLTEFTTGQVARALAMIEMYRSINLPAVQTAKKSTKSKTVSSHKKRQTLH